MPPADRLVSALVCAHVALTLACPATEGIRPGPDAGGREAEGEGESEGESEGEGEGEAIALDCPSEQASSTLEELAMRFEAEIYPLMARPAGEGGCIACHADGSDRLMRMAPTARDTFFRMRAAGYLRPTAGMISERVVNESMPPGDEPRWAPTEKEALVSFSCALATVDASGTPADEEFPPDLDTPWTGAVPTNWDNTFLTYDQLRKRVIQAFDDDWVREGVDKFSENIALFGGVDFVTTFVPARQATPEFLVAFDVLAEDVCARAASDLTGPFAGLDLDAPLHDDVPSATRSFEAETSTITGLPDGCLPRPNATSVTLCTNATVSAPVTLPIAGEYRLRALVRGDPNVAGDPIAVLRVDGIEALTTTVPETTFVERSVSVPLSAGVHTIAVAFTNDSVVAGDDRNLFVDRFSIEGPLPGSADTAPNARADALTRLATVFARLLLRAPARDDGMTENDEVLPLYDLLLTLEAFDGDRRGGYAGVCQGLLRHPDFLFTRPPAFDTATGGERERLLLIKSAFDVMDRPPSPDELTQFALGTSRAELLDTWLASDEARLAYFQRVRQVLESDGTIDGDEPARLWTYVMMNDRPLKEILTADYTVDETFTAVERPAEHGATGLLTMKGYIKGKPGLPHFNYAARVLTGFFGTVFEVPQEALDARATASATSTVDPTTVCYSCHRLLTPLAHQRLKWDDDGDHRTHFDDGRPIDDSDQGLVADYPFRGAGLESFSLVAVRKEGFIRRMANVHFLMSFGRNMRHLDDERTVYRAAWDAAASGNGTFKDIIRAIHSSQSYTNPPGPLQDGGAEDAP